MRLIDGDALKVSYCKQCLKETRNEQVEVKQTPYCVVACQDFDVIDRQPTIDAVPVVHGEWTTKRTWQHDGEIYCSVCDSNAPTEGDYRQVKTNYCPNCGAKMDGKENADADS